MKLFISADRKVHGSRAYTRKFIRVWLVITLLNKVIQYYVF